MMINIWWFHLVQEVLEQLWHQLRKVAVLSTHAYASPKTVGVLSGAPVLWVFSMIGFHQGVWRCIAGHVCLSHHQRKPASGWFCQSWFQLIVTECVFEHSSVPAPWWVFVAQLFGPPGGAIEAVQTPQFLRSGWLDNFHVLYHQKLSCAQTFLRHFHTFATVKFSGLDQFCTGLRPVSQTQRKERQREGGIVRPWYSDLWLRKRRPTWVGSIEEVLRNPGF